MKWNSFIKYLKNLFITKDFDRVIIFALIVQLFSFVLFQMYKAVFSVPIISFIFLIITMLWKKLSRLCRSTKLIYSINAVLMISGFSILIGLVMLRPNFTPVQAQRIVIQDFNTKFKEEIKSKTISRITKTEGTSYFIRHNYIIDLETNDKEFFYIFDPITGKFSFDVYNKNTPIEKIY